ncbi:MAG: glycosyltransferase family 39 protein [Acidobacteria bacterium]|nr:glycosyltransferase family 39 protein [Acidobacteriota bacterium]
MALFYLLTMYASARAMDARRPALWQGAAIVSCALGMACKESMVTAPLMVVIYDVVFVSDSLRPTLKKRGALYAGLAAGWIVPRALAEQLGADDGGRRARESRTARRGHRAFARGGARFSAGALRARRRALQPGRHPGGFARSDAPAAAPAG